MNALNVIGAIVAATIIALAGIAVVVAAAAPLLLVQSASATTDVLASTTVGGGEEGGATTSGNTTTTNNSNVTLLGNLFYSAQGIEQTFNPINETYIVISYLDNVTLMPPNATGVVINATETGNFTVNIQPNGLSMDQGQGFIMTKEDGGQEGENATATFVSLSRTNPDGTGSGTGVVFLSTNSTGQLAFLNNMLGIAQVEFSPEGSTVRIWEWRGGTLPSQNEG